ncbi:uncharacterized protein Dwil_GK24524 [Drosophila willistoni]|uniref:Alpha-mannosidase n=1 Tax=Drosophila willistoni TaxID=7260 RepID=B4N087_DROWI|nr:lysosomal alpha-mannosidase [Drosophila willistoni]EDW77500.1 uncharacterized protein Dwil_GK24524 [Drosophila willistoni]
MKHFAGLILFAILFAITIKGSQSVCGYESCPQSVSNLINIHLVPHSHDDVGWLKTADQYYYGHRQNIQHASVKYIFESVVSELIKDPSRRFIQVETAFFEKWWVDQPETTKQIVRKLVNEGRFEFIGGAWSMNDEGAVNYQSVIDQFTLGLKFLDDNFGACGRPHVGWQIDAFGHSREMASMFAQMGFDGEFFARMDHSDKDVRLGNLGLEMIWDASESLSNLEFFTGMLYNHYSAPPGFCFDRLCGDDPIIDEESYDNNVKSRVDDFLNYVAGVAEHYRSNNILIPMGDDFHYENAQQNYQNMDKLIKYVNQRQADGSRYNIFYSTASCYLNSLHKGLQTWPNKTQDFLPHSNEAKSYWTGYFTSRPTQKRFERDGNHMLQTAKQLSTFANLSSDKQTKDLDYLRKIMGVMQHHDAITGTEKQHVSDDYDRLLYDGIVGAENNARDALRVLTNLTNGEFESCMQLNISVCAFTKDSADDVVVTLFNPLAHPSTQYVKVPVKDESYEVTDEKGTIIASEVVPVAWQVLALEHRSNDTQHELIFKASVDKIASYYITKSKSTKTSGRWTLPGGKSEDTVLETSLIKLVIDKDTGRLKTVEMNGISEEIEQIFAVYKTRESCHYIFRENDEIEVLTDDVEFSVYDGTLVKEVHQQVNEFISQVIRIYEGVNRVEFEWLVGPIPIDGDVGMEVITRFQSSISSKGVFYTDSNGREVMKREKNKRESFDPDLSIQPTSANYYPVTSRISLNDGSRRMSLLNDRSEAGTSMEDGRLELMLHRRHVFHDGSGADEAINEEQFGKGLIARGKIQLVLNKVEDKNTIPERLAEKEIHLPFAKFFSKRNTATNKVIVKTLPDFSDFPQSVHLLTLEPFSKNEILFRVENFLDHTEGNVVSFNIRSIFDTLGGVEIRETTLDGNLPLSEMKRLKFYHDGAGARPTTAEYFTATHKPLAADKSQEVSEFSVTLQPMQIRTFIITYE